MEIDLHSPEPSYRQLAAILRARIVSGELQPRDPLPSLTRLQQESGLALNTVRHAVGVLVSEGLVVSVQGRGSFVADRPADSP